MLTRFSERIFNQSLNLTTNYQHVFIVITVYCHNVNYEINITNLGDKGIQYQATTNPIEGGDRSPGDKSPSDQSPRHSYLLLYHKYMAIKVLT